MTHRAAAPPDGAEVGHPRRWAILVAICAALLVTVVDSTVLNVALPTVATAFGASTTEQQAVLDAYAIVFSGLLITSGALSDRWGRRRAMVAGLTLLGLASAAATLAWTVWWLVAMRALMGLGAALIMPATLALLMHVFPAHERPRVFAIWGAVASGAMAAGPALGGALVAMSSWAGAFWINVPVVAVAVTAVIRLVPESRPARVRPVDPPSAALITVGMVALTVVVILAGESGVLRVPVLAGAAAAVLALAGFVRRQRRLADPVVDLALYRDRRFAGGSAAVTLIAVGNGSTLFVLTQYLQLVRGMTPLQAGLACSPLAAGIVVGSLAGGRAPARMGLRRPIIAGFSATAAGFALLAALTPHSPYGLVAVGLVVVGLGNGFASPATTSTILGAVPPDRAGMGSALNDTHQQFGVAFGVALIGSLLATVYRSGLPPRTPARAGESLSAALAYAERLPGGEAFADAARSAFTTAQTVCMLFAAACVALGVVSAAVLLRREP
jgi:EmrB/QacA subfamily drug resistance transporter